MSLAVKYQPLIFPLFATAIIKKQGAFKDKTTSTKALMHETNSPQGCGDIAPGLVASCFGENEIAVALTQLLN